MKYFLFLVIFLIPIITNAQLLESQIPFLMDSDNDTQLNKVDTDDDNDAVLDNLDLFPLDPTLSSPIILTTNVDASADAGLRNNTTGAANTNYGADPSVQTKNIERSLIMKFIQPANLDLMSATLTVYTSSENDPIEVYFLPSSSWVENTITYNNNLTNFNARALLGITGTPTGGKYTFNIPLNIFSSTGGPITILVYDPNDPSGATELFYTKETSGKTPYIEFKHRQSIPNRVITDQSQGTMLYLNGVNKEVGFKLTQAPTADVYLPIEISNPSVAHIVGNQVLVFNASNWNIFQTVNIEPFGLGVFDVFVKPLHSNDIFFNGHNPTDLFGYKVQSTNITNLSNWTLATGDTLDVLLAIVNAVGSLKFDFRILSGPVGFNVVERSGQLSFRPVINQIGTHNSVIEIIDEFGNVSTFNATITVTNGNVADPVGKYVVLNKPNDPMANGSTDHPYNNIVDAVNSAINTGGGNVFIRGGEYNLEEVIVLSSDGPSNNPIVIKPLNGEHVKINYGLRAAFDLDTFSSYIQIKGLEIDGGTDLVDFWCIVAQAFWGDPTIPRGGGIGIVLNGTYLTAEGNYIHDSYQKALEIPGGRYVKAYDNIIHNIATTSLSGGHGIMRQQKGREFFDNDTVNYRWDLKGNLIYNVEQRIYSWVPSKGFIEMVLDEGKPILIDDPKDTNGQQEYMKARIKNNVIAFGSIDQLRLKSTPNLEVSNNSVYSAGMSADGITDKVGDTNTPKFVNFTFINNAVQTNIGTQSIEIQDAVNQANVSGSVLTVTNNYSAGGTNTPNTQSGLNNLGASQLFVDAINGNFHLNPALSLPTTVGVHPTMLDSINDRKSQYGVTVKWDRWLHDHLKLTQTILDNIPGVNDGVNGNETVFTNFGNMNNTHTEIHFNVVYGAWKQETGSPATQDFHLNPVYASWYHRSDSLYQNASFTDYERIRWGNSFLKQNQVFDNDWLTISQITSDSTNTIISGMNNVFTLDGDILIDFENYTPLTGESFDLIEADVITSLNSPNLFDRILFEGYTPPSYTLTIENIPSGGQVVRLTILGGCSLLVSNTNDVGTNSLRDIIACAMNGDTIMISPILIGDTIKLTSTQLLINKNLTIISPDQNIYIQNCTPNTIQIDTGKIVTLQNFTILSDSFTNNGNLKCTNMIYKTKLGTGDINFLNSPGATLEVNSLVKME